MAVYDLFSIFVFVGINVSDYATQQALVMSLRKKRSDSSLTADLESPSGTEMRREFVYQLAYPEQNRVTLLQGTICSVYIRHSDCGWCPTPPSPLYL